MTTLRVPARRASAPSPTSTKYALAGLAVGVGGILPPNRHAYMFIFFVAGARKGAATSKMLAILQDACDLEVKARLRLIPAGWIDKHRAVRARRSEASAEVLQSFGRSLRRRGPHSIQRLDVPSNTPCSLVGNHTETRTRANARCCAPATYAPGLGSPPATSAPRLSSCRAISDRDDRAAAGRVQMAIGMGDAKGLYGYSIKSEVRPACPAKSRGSFLC